MRYLFTLCLLLISCMAHAVQIDGWNVQSNPIKIVPNLMIEQEVETYTGDMMVHKTESKPTAGHLYLLVPLTVSKIDKKAPVFRPSDLRLKIGEHTLNRLPDDTFLIDYNIVPLTRLNLKLGAHKGTVIFEIPEKAAQEKAVLLYNTTSMELK